MRYILEGEWSGYHSGQRHIVHRTILTEKQFKKINKQKLSRIRCIDGTYLALRVFSAKPGECIKIIHGYDNLIDKCLSHKCNSRGEEDDKG